jgi:hypothetical protein
MSITSWKIKPAAALKRLEVRIDEYRNCHLFDAESGDDLTALYGIDGRCSMDKDGRFLFALRPEAADMLVTIQQRPADHAREPPDHPPVG